MTEFNLKHISIYIKEYRKTHSLSLDQLASRSEVSPSMICHIEAGKTIPTISVLWKLAEAMNVPISHLVDPGCKRKHFIVRRPSEDLCTVSKDKAFACYLLTSGSQNRKVEIFGFEALKKGTYEILALPQGTTEYIVIHSGELWVTDSDHEVSLKEGDCIEFLATRNHLLEQRSKNHAKGIIIRHFC